MGLNDNERDITLWKKFREGDELAFESLFTKYYSLLFNYGCKITSDHTIVEDSIQELFLELWKSGAKAEVISAKAYFFKAFKFKLLKLITKNNKSQLLPGNYPGSNAFEISHEILLINKEQDANNAKKIVDAFESLSPRQKEIIYLKFYQDLSYEAVSEIMDINYQAARNLIYQSVKALRKAVVLYLVLQFFLSNHTA